MIHPDLDMQNHFQSINPLTTVDQLHTANHLPSNGCYSTHHQSHMGAATMSAQWAPPEHISSERISSAIAEALPPGGKPLRITNPNLSGRTVGMSTEYYAARFPAGVDLLALAERNPLTIRRDTPPEGEDDDDDAVGGGGGERQAGRRLKSNSVPVDHEPWRISVGSYAKEYVGRREGLDTHGYFLYIDRGPHIELVPLDGWYSFTPENAVGKISSDIAERKRRARFAKEIANEEQVSKLVVQRNESDEDDDNAASTKKQKRLSPGSRDPLFDDDRLGLKRQEHKRVKHVLKKRNEQVKDVDKDDAAYDSALAFGHLKKPTVDWDFDKDGVMSDDEEPCAGSEGDNNADGLEEKGQSEFEDSEDEDSKLTKFGQKMSQLLVNQREKEADDELAEFSEGDDLAGSSDEASTGGAAKDSRGGDSEGGAMPGQLGEHLVASRVNSPDAFGATGGAEPQMSMVNDMGGTHLISPMHGTALPRIVNTMSGMDDTSSMAHGYGISGASPTDRVQRGHGAATQPPAGVSRSMGIAGTTTSEATGRGSAASRVSSGGGDSRAELQSSLIRSFNRHSGRMTASKVMEELNVTGKGSRFNILKELLLTMCSVEASSDSKGKKVQILELKEQYRKA